MEVVNPKISFTSLGVKANKGSKMIITDMYTVLKQCASGDWKGKDKGFACILPYVSKTFGPTELTFDGVIFVDLDKFNDYDELKGFQQTIFDNFENLCQYMPCLLAMKYSPSGNIHAFIYHNHIKDANHYRELGALYLAVLSLVIKKVTGVDLRKYDGVLDGHQMSPYQKFNVNDTPFQWNVYCTAQTFCRADINKIKVEYANIFKGASVQRQYGVVSTVISGNGDTCVNNDYIILGKQGYEARTAIASAAYFHFKQDISATRDWLQQTFSNAEEINKQLTNMVNNNKIANKYDSNVEEYLFGKGGRKITLANDEYLSNVINFDELNKKWYYIISNTNTGKTEFVKGLTKGDRRIIILQMNKALRDGKKQGIEGITMGNFRWDNIVSKEQIHTTVEGFIRNCNELDLSEYIIVVDEAHLLQDYSAIPGKMSTNRDLLEVLPNADKIIFMSATPKTEIKLFDFEILEFEKIQHQNLDIICHPIKYIGRGSKEVTRYNYIINYIKKTTQDSGYKSVIFSNKYQECWKKYGLKDIDYTWFHSMNKDDANVCSILDFNKLSTDITLATIYLGVGVEIKNEKEIHIWFDLNEGWDKDFIIQSLGRPRDAQVIHIHFFFTADKDITSVRLNDREVEAIEMAFGHLIELHDDDGCLPTVNLIAARMTGVYDSNFNIYKCKDKVQALKVGQIISNKEYMTVYDMDLLRKLPYSKITVKYMDAVDIDTENKKRIKRHETDLEEFLLSRSDGWWLEHETKTYNELLDELDILIIDRKNGRTMIEKCKYIWRKGFNLRLVFNYFGSINKAYEIIGWLCNYCDVKTGSKSITEFDGARQDIITSIKGQFDTVERIFNTSYLQWRVDKILLKQPIRAHSIVYNDDMLELLGIEVEVSDNASNDQPDVFNGNSYNDIVGKKKKERMEKLGKSKAKSIKIQNLETGEVLEFDTQKAAADYLKISKSQISKILKGSKNITNWKLTS